MSVPTVRHHLSILISDGRVTASGGAVPTHRRGRPQKLFRLSDKMLGGNLAALTDSLLMNRPDLRVLALRLQERMGSFDEKLSATRRLEKLVEKLNEAHYDAHWEAGAEGPRILFGHCPYAEVIDTHPELCGMDGYLLGGILNAEVEQTAKLDRKTGRPDRCVFALRRVKRGG